MALPTKIADQVAGCVVLLFSGLVIAESLRIPDRAVAFGRTSFAPGPGFLPFWAGLVLAALAIMLILSASFRARGDGSLAAVAGPGALGSVVLLVLILAAYIFFLDILGYLACTIILNLFLMRVVMRSSWILSFNAAILVSAALFVLFQVMLGVQLPSNSLGLWS